MEAIESLLEKEIDEKLYRWFYEPTPYVEDSLKNLFNIYEEEGYPQKWSEFRFVLNESISDEK
jgi:hypothetical protein